MLLLNFIIMYTPTDYTSVTMGDIVGIVSLGQFLGVTRAKFATRAIGLCCLGVSTTCSEYIHTMTTVRFCTYFFKDSSFC